MPPDRGADRGWKGGRKRGAEKRPVIAGPEPSRAKIPHRPLEDMYQLAPGKRRPVWKFSTADFGGPWCPSLLSAEQHADLLQKLASFESMTLDELQRPGVEHYKTYPAEDLPNPNASKRLVEISRDDETEISRFRLSGKSRLYGFMRENVFHVLWCDMEHEVWPSSRS